jgi:hypothetical protein
MSDLTDVCFVSSSSSSSSSSRSSNSRRRFGTHSKPERRRHSFHRIFLPHSTNIFLRTMALRLLARGYLLCIFISVLLHHCPNLPFTALWAIAQWFPSYALQRQLQEKAWKHWEHDRAATAVNKTLRIQIDIPVVDVQRQRTRLLSYLQETYGNDWRKRPLLLQGLWTQEELRNSSRKLSLSGLLKEELQIPYFSDARIKGALAPDQSGSISDIVRNITELGAPHKIGTQYFVQIYPELIQEVAPAEIVSLLFGNYFEPKFIKGSGPFGMFPAMTTVPVFVAQSQRSKQPNSKTENAVPFTGLHCEPIGNVAVQLSGQKKWTLVSPEYSHLIRPSLAPDGRAFFASNVDLTTNAANYVPMYSATTKAGDAIWVPTWTWHRVDYLPSKDIAIGGSLFHFRPLDFVANNPLFAGMILPALFLELIGYNTQ